MTHQVRRGGTWCHTVLVNGRSAYRSVLPSRELDSYTGFRVVCLPREVKPATQIAVRGNTWLDDSVCGCRSVYRDWWEPTVTASTVGFRVVCLPPPEKDGQRMAVRGGAWNWSSSLWSGLTRSHRSSFRGRSKPFTIGSGRGFRVVCLPQEVAP